MDVVALLLVVWSYMKWIGTGVNNSPDLLFSFFVDLAEGSFFPAFYLWNRALERHAKTMAIIQAYRKRKNLQAKKKVYQEPARVHAELRDLIKLLSVNVYVSYRG